MISDLLRRLLRDQNEFASRRERLAQASPHRLHLWPALIEAGVIGALAPEEAGGFGGAGRDIATIAYEVGRSLAVEPLLGVLGSIRLLVGAGTECAARELCQVVSGRRIVVLAHEEGFDPFAQPSVRVRSEGGVYWLDGVKPVVANADVADAFIVTATLHDGTVGCFLVEADGEGVDRSLFRLLDSGGGGTLSMTAAPATALVIGEAAQAAIVDAVEWSLLAMCAEAVAIIDALNEVTYSYLVTRVQFGVAIASFQALRHRVADMFIAGEEAGVATDTVADALDSSVAPLRSARISALKAIVDSAGRKVSHEAVQMHGGVGVSDELIVSHYTRRLATIRARFGSADMHRDRFSSLTA